MNDNNLIPCRDILNSDWLNFGCIHCIKEHHDYTDLDKPINITCQRVGVITIVKGVCCNGHELVISTKKKKRKYDEVVKHMSFDQPKRFKYISYDVNILLTMASYCNGSGETALQRFVHALGIPGNIQKMYHTVSKAYLSPLIQKEVGNCVRENLIEEIRLILAESHKRICKREWENISRWLNGVPGVARIPTFPQIGLDVSTDMGWQKRASGNKYDSPSGHMFLIGTKTRKVIKYKVYLTNCATCEKSRSLFEPIPQHYCAKNFNGSAKAMEATAAREMIEELYGDYMTKIYCQKIVADDDSSMQSHCSHKGGLKEEIPDISYRSQSSM